MGPGNGEPARTPGAGVCSGPFLEALALSKPGITLVSLKCIPARWAYWLLQGANLSGCFRVIWEPITISLGIELLDPGDLKS